MRRALVWLVEALARLGDPAVCRFANVTDAWDDYGYHDAPTPPNPSQENG